MVSNAKQGTRSRRVNQAVQADIPEPNKIGASTPYDFQAHNLTAYGGLLPVATMLEKLGFQQLIEENLTIQRRTRAMPVFRFILGMILACYVGFSRLHHLRFLKREPMLTGILHVAELPPQSTFWRFLASLHLGIARQLLTVEKRMRERVSTPATKTRRWGPRYGRRPTSNWRRSPSTPTPRCTRCSATRWARARVTTRRTRARRATSRSSASLPRRGNIPPARCAPETGPTAARSPRIWTPSPRAFLQP